MLHLHTATLADLQDYEQQLIGWQILLEREGDWVEARSIAAEKFHVQSLIRQKKTAAQATA